MSKAAHKSHGFRAPIAMATWAFAADEFDSRLQNDLRRRIRLRSDPCESGGTGWIIDILEAPAGVSQMLGWVKAGPLKEKAAKIRLRDRGGQAIVQLLSDFTGMAPGAGGAL